MKYLIILLVVILVACASPSKQDDPTAKATAANLQQHIAIAVTLAKFYCTNNYWPKSLKSLQEFSANVKLPLPAKINWSWLEQSEVIYKVTENAYLKTPDESSKGGGVSVSSINEPPKCNGNDMKINVRPTIGG